MSTTFSVIVARIEAAICLQEQAELQTIVAGRRLDDEAVLAGRNDWRPGLGLLRVRVGRLRTKPGSQVKRSMPMATMATPLRDTRQTRVDLQCKSHDDPSTARFS